MSKLPKTFYGHAIDYSNPFLDVIYLAPDYTVKAGEVYPVGKGYAFATRDTQAAEKGRFEISGTFRFDCEMGTNFCEDEHVALDPKTLRLVPKGTPGAILDLEIVLCVPRENGECPFAWAYLEQKEIR